MKIFKILILTTLISILILFSYTFVKSSENSHSNSQSKVEKTSEKAGHGEVVEEEHEKTAEEGHGEEAEEEEAWRFPGWQSIFAILAVGYYIAVSLNLLPKIAAKDLEEHH